MSQVVFSMIQPSGSLGIGHYLGAIKHWKKLQDDKSCQCIFAIANLHAITVPQDPRALRKCTLDLVAFYLACGIDPEDSLIFTQSDVPQHAELAWILSCMTSMGELNRMTQFKDKTSQMKRERIAAGLYSYPALMASDILLYKTDIVPVGADQKQHIELTRDLAMRFNQSYGEVLTVPKPVIAEVGARIMALGDPMKKMSKSDKDANNYIALSDDPKLIRKKVMRAVTDSLGVFQYDEKEQRGLANLIELYSACTDLSIEDVVEKFSGAGYGDFKKELANALVEMVEGINVPYEHYRRRESDLLEVMQLGAKKASVIAQSTIEEVYEAMGLL